MIRTIILALFLCFLEGHASFISGSIGTSHLKSSVYSPSKPYPSLYLELGFFDDPSIILDFKYSLGLRRYGFFYQKKSYAISSIVVKPIMLSVTIKGLMVESYTSLYQNFLADEVVNGRNNDEVLFFSPRTGAGYGFRAGYYVTESFLIALNYEYSTLTFDWPAEFYYYHLSFQWNFESLIDYINPIGKTEKTGISVNNFING